MGDSTLHLTVRTPHDVLLETEAESVRVPTETGQVGVRPRIEPQVLSVAAGLVLVRGASGLRYVGTAGGLLTCDGQEATLLTPLAVVGDGAGAVLALLDEALQAPNSEMTARAILGQLESRIITELRDECRVAKPGGEA